MVETLMDGLVSEIERCSKLKAMYDQIPSGAFGALMIQQDIDRAKEAIASEDLAEMIQSYEALKRMQVKKMLYEPNTIDWRVGAFVIHDADAKRASINMNVEERALKYKKELVSYFLSLCFSTLAFFGIIISVILFGLGVLSVDQTSKWVFAMFVVFVVDQLFVKRLGNWLKSKKLLSHSK